MNLGKWIKNEHLEKKDNLMNYSQKTFIFLKYEANINEKIKIKWNK